MKKWVLFTLFFIACYWLISEYKSFKVHQLDVLYWTQCHEFIDLIPSNIHGLRPDPGGTVLVTNAPTGETTYVSGTMWPHDHCFDPEVCGVYSFNYSGEFDCQSSDDPGENCESIGRFTVTVPCEGGGGDDCCEKYLVEISAPYELKCGECAEICAVTNNYINPVYEWSTGETTQCIEICSAGEYSVIVMEQIDEDCMCMHVAIEKINILDSDLSCALDNLTVCQGDVGIFDLLVQGGSQNYSYSWSGPDGFSSSVEDPIVSTEGLYQVEVTDSEGCVVMCSANLFIKTITPIVECPI